MRSLGGLSSRGWSVNSGLTVKRRPLEKYVKRRNILLHKYMRKAVWRLMIRVMPREVARFIQSKFGELKIPVARYEDLLSEADENYPRYLDLLTSGIYA
ncbi:MAG: hypothetical protein ACO2OS_04990 [Thermosphaera aggregans]|uniref:hypothetical protein n=1 Tax=Thermosphaera aggregans TaxID=54254 RepID=UPI003C11AF0F